MKGQSVKVSAIVFFRVIDPEKAVIQVEQFYNETSQIAQTTLRSVLGQHELDEMLAERDKLNADIQTILDQQTEAERERRAKVIHAEGELQASHKLVEAAQTLAQSPRAIQLRYLQTLTEIAGDKSNTIVFPLPMDILESIGIHAKTE